VRRVDLHELAAAVAAAAGVDLVVDPTNEDERFRRNWVRHTVLPLLASGAERDLVPVIARQARVMADEADLLDALADELLDAAGRDEPAVITLRAAPRPLVRRALRRWLGPPWPSLADLARVEAVLDGTHRATEIAGGIRIHRSDGRMRRGLACASDADANDEGDA
jgi:tRNA(Ile)-lysidine synthase